jgi:hypothetical protein
VQNAEINSPVARTNTELWWAFIIILFTSIFYLFAVIIWQKIPNSSELIGHSIGILGFMLMLMTETLYSFRKRSHDARWGRMSAWLRFHIVTGLVGPYMVFLHTAFKFNGLAGIVMLFTVVIVISGFIGRYIYTAIPRTADGVEIEAQALARYIAEIDARVQDLSSRTLEDKNQSRKLESLHKRQRALHRQIDALAKTRRLLALWHTIHVPIGIVLFTAAIIHIIAAVYYATLPRLLGQ